MNFQYFNNVKKIAIISNEGWTSLSDSVKIFYSNIKLKLHYFTVWDVWKCNIKNFKKGFRNIRRDHCCANKELVNDAVCYVIEKNKFQKEAEKAKLELEKKLN